MERPISIVGYSRHSGAACVSASCTGPGRREGLDGGPAIAL